MCTGLAVIDNAYSVDQAATGPYQPRSDQATTGPRSDQAPSYYRPIPLSIRAFSDLPMNLPNEIIAHIIFFVDDDDRVTLQSLRNMRGRIGLIASRCKTIGWQHRYLRRAAAKRLIVPKRAPRMTVSLAPS